MLLSYIINPDRTGIIHGCHSSTNVRRLLNIIQFTAQLKHKVLAISLDHERAFDRVEIELYCFQEVLERFDLGGDFLKWIKTINHSLTACVIINGLCADSFPLAEAISFPEDVRGVMVGGSSTKLHYMLMMSF